MENNQEAVLSRSKGYEIVKKYVRVNADFTEDGQLIPNVIFWDDGRRYAIDRVKDCCRRASLKAGGEGLRYTCMVRGREVHLFYEENYRWFVEAVRYRNPS